MVMQLIRDYEDVQAVNAQLEKMCVDAPDGCVARGWWID